MVIHIDDIFITPMVISLPHSVGLKVGAVK